MPLFVFHLLQKINHLPSMTEICHKNSLATNWKHMLKFFPKDYNIFPRTWTFPIECVCLFSRVMSARVSLSDTHATPFSFAGTVCSNPTLGTKTNVTYANPTRAAKAKVSPSSRRGRKFSLNMTWSVRSTSTRWVSQKRSSEKRFNPSLRSPPAAAHRRLQVRHAYLRAGDLVLPLEDLHVQRGPGSLLHHQVWGADGWERGELTCFSAWFDCIKQRRV